MLIFFYCIEIFVPPPLSDCKQNISPSFCTFYTGQSKLQSSRGDEFIGLDIVTVNLCVFPEIWHLAYPVSMVRDTSQLEGKKKLFSRGISAINFSRTDRT